MKSDKELLDTGIALAIYKKLRKEQLSLLERALKEEIPLEIRSITPGPEGRRGIIGPRGEKGSMGPRGPQGIEGPEGPQGPEGPIGKTPDVAPAVRMMQQEVEEKLKQDFDKIAQQASARITSITNSFESGNNSGGGEVWLKKMADVSMPSLEDGYVITWDQGQGKFILAPSGAGLSGVDASPSMPPSPFVGQSWFDASTGGLFVWDGSAWQHIGTQGYSSGSPPPSPTAGDQWFDNATLTLYNFNGSVWEIINVGLAGVVKTERFLADSFLDPSDNTKAVINFAAAGISSISNFFAVDPSGATVEIAAEINSTQIKFDSNIDLSSHEFIINFEPV